MAMYKPGNFRKTGYYLIFIVNKDDKDVWFYETVYSMYAPFSSDPRFYLCSVYSDYDNLEILGWKYLGNEFPEIIDINSMS